MPRKKARSGTTPLMKQYYQIKAQHPDAIVLFRMGDFYETFGEDAIVTAKALGITLTKRGHGSAGEIELAGFPYHALDNYLPRLTQAGYRVAICEQLEDPKKAKKLVKRGVIEVISPGTALTDEGEMPPYLAAVVSRKMQAGLALVNLSTGEFLATQGHIDYVRNLLATFQPREVLVPRTADEGPSIVPASFYQYPLEAWFFEEDFGYQRLTEHFGTHNLKGFGIEEWPLAIAAAGATLYYLQQSKFSKLPHLRTIRRLEKGRHLWLDAFTLRNLEVIRPMMPGGKSLLDVVDGTLTPMGRRMLRQWLTMPLLELRKIMQRHDIVAAFLTAEGLTASFRRLLDGMGDIEQLASRLAMQKLTPRHLVRLAEMIRRLEQARTLTTADDAPEAIREVAGHLRELSRWGTRIRRTIEAEPPTQISQGGVIRSGVDAELDQLRHLMHSANEVLAGILAREKERTGIPSLKLGFNNVFGYYLEVTHAHKARVPREWIRKQTLTQAERYITPELKEWEEKILTAREKALSLEQRLFHDLLQELLEMLPDLQWNASLIASLDVLQGFAEVARQHHYVRPRLSEAERIVIRKGRHPVIEQALPPDRPYVPNDLYLDKKKQQIIVLTGPNMSGKSAYLRQNALILILAQAGAFVPAQSAEIGIVDKIFSRVGASDNIASGESTFMVEMNEAANILNNLSPRSFVIFDEIGRGTSTYDGLSIAWAITEYLHQHPHRPFTLFATHYHELNELARQYERIHNFHVAVEEGDRRIIFLHQVLSGGSEQSFGIEVARMAGVPPWVVERAQKILAHLQQSHVIETPGSVQPVAPGLFDAAPHPDLEKLLRQLQSLDPNTLSPIEALLKLQALVRAARKIK